MQGTNTQCYLTEYIPDTLESRELAQIAYICEQNQMS